MLNSKLGKKRGFLLFLILLFVFCLKATNVTWEHFKFSESGALASSDFFSAALDPAFDYQTDGISPSRPYWVKLFSAAWLTIKYATCGFTIALLFSLPLGVIASKSWWNIEASGPLFRFFLKALHRVTKTIITAGRSIHELLWGLFFMSAIGTSPWSIILAIAIPYGCTLGKVFSELLDEQETKCRDQLRNQGGTTFTSWTFSTVPLALSDLLSYALYRYECSIRSAAIFGFVGLETIGTHIADATADGYWNEVWTLIYLLLIIILVVERLSTIARNLLSKPQQVKLPKNATTPTLTQLTKFRPRNLYLKAFLTLSLSFVVFAWFHDSLFPNVELLDDRQLNSILTTEQRWSNFNRFLTRDLTPAPVRDSGNWSDAIPWAKALFLEKGVEALLQTFYIATAAMILAWFSAITVLPFGSKVLNSIRPFGVHSGTSLPAASINYISSCTLRFLFVISRAIPEYLLAFVLFLLFPISAWPLILALAIHNFGIVGRLGGELIDNREYSHTKQQLSQGSSRFKVYLFSLLPSHFNRFLLYFFYRWETCVRDATVLGMLAMASIGAEILDADAKQRYDEMLFFMLLGAAIVMVGDLTSDIVRARLRRST